MITIARLKRAEKQAREALELRDKAIGMAQAAEEHAARLQTELTAIKSKVCTYLDHPGRKKDWDDTPKLTKELREATGSD